MLCFFTHAGCKVGYWMCEDSSCVPEDQVCDGSKDCPDGTDEGAECGKHSSSTSLKHASLAVILL